MDEDRQLKRGFVVVFSQGRRRKGVLPPPRFLVLAPKRKGEQYRRTAAAGYVVNGDLVIDHGMLDAELGAGVIEAAGKAL